MKKSIIIFLSVLAMSLTFSGCGSEGSTSVSTENVTTTTNTSSGDTASGTTDTGITEEEVSILVASKTSLEDIFGAVPANPGN